MTITEQLKAKTEALRSIQNYIEKLRELRQEYLGPRDDLDDVNMFIEQQINNYKQLVKDLRKQHGE